MARGTFGGLPSDSEGRKVAVMDGTAGSASPEEAMRLAMEWLIRRRRAIGLEGPRTVQVAAETFGVPLPDVAREFQSWVEREGEIVVTSVHD